MRDEHLLPRPRTADWRDQAACKDTPTEVFFTVERTAEALAVCQGCPVRVPCAAAGRHEVGIWGGRIPSSRGHHKPGTPVGTPVVLTCAECGDRFAHVVATGTRPAVCSQRCRKDRDLRLAREARRARGGRSGAVAS